MVVDSEKGRRAWLHWSGLGQSPEDLHSWTARLAPHKDELNAIAKRLYQPPGENDTGSEGTDPDADLLMEKLAKTLGARTRPFWPKEAPYAVCVTHDIDRIFATYQRLRGFFHSPLQTVKRVAQDMATWMVAARHEENSFHNMKRVRQIEKEWGISSAAYVLFERPRPWFALKRGEFQHLLGAYSPEDIMADLKDYEASGNEVGIHGSFDSWNNAVLLTQERQDMRIQGFTDIRGTRNHYLQYDLLQTPPAQVKAGFVYDSTLGFNLRSGFRCGTCFPFQLQGLLEIPLLLMDTALRHECNTWKARQERADQILSQVRARHGVLMLNWHMQFMNPAAFPEWVAILASLVRQARADGAWFTLPKDLADWWNARSGESAV